MACQVQGFARRQQLLGAGSEVLTAMLEPGLMSSASLVADLESPAFAIGARPG